MATVYLYKYREYVHLTQADRNVPNINLPMIQYDTKIYKGVTNTIDFIVRNNDRKPIKIIGYTMIAQIREVNNSSRSETPPEVLLEKQLIVVDETAGKVKLVLQPEDIENWKTGYYCYNIRTVDLNGQMELLYTDINKDTLTTFELIEGIASSLVPAKEITSSHFTPSAAGNYGTIWKTGALPGDAQSQRANGTHTIAVYTTNWLGKIWVEGSLTNEPPLPSEWFYVTIGDNTDWLEINEHNNSGVKLINFTTNLYWIRISYQPNPVNKGIFERILYKS